MPFEVHTEDDLGKVEAEALKRGAAVNGSGPKSSAPKLLTVEEVKKLKTHTATMLVEKLVTLPGLTLMNAPGKTGKTLLGAQISMSVAAGVPVFDYYDVLPGPALFVEKDDPSGATSIRDILNRTKLPIDGKPFVTVDTADAQRLALGPDFILWLDQIIPSNGFKLVVLDSYTALRGIREGGGDIVKTEAGDLLLLDEIAKKHAAAILLLPHYSKGSVNHDWSERAAGTYAMSAASEAQITLTRFPDLASNAPERLVRVRGRHFEGVEVVLRLQPETLNYELVLGACPRIRNFS